MAGTSAARQAVEFTTAWSRRSRRVADGTLVQRRSSPEDLALKVFVGESGRGRPHGPGHSPARPTAKSIPRGPQTSSRKNLPSERPSTLRTPPRPGVRRRVRSRRVPSPGGHCGSWAARAARSRSQSSKASARERAVERHQTGLVAQHLRARTRAPRARASRPASARRGPPVRGRRA